MTATLVSSPDKFLLGQLARSVDIRHQALVRAADPDFPAWLGHVRAAAKCSRPIRLRGEMLTVEAVTGRVLSSTHTDGLPDGVIYKACGNRRESVCPACSAVYKRDAFEIVRSLLIGGNGVPDSVARHPAVFPTLTAPSFGEVHTHYVRNHSCPRRDRCDCRPEPCHARRGAPRCPHGRLMACFARHGEGDRIVGSALCPDCYDYAGQVVWNLEVPELWRRTTIAMTRYLNRLCRDRGIPFWTVIALDGSERTMAPFRLTFNKVAEYQARGAVHLHAVIRLDGFDPDQPDTELPPPAGLDVDDLVHAIATAAASTAFQTRSHPAKPEGWCITWGDPHKGTEVRPVKTDAEGNVDLSSAYYLSKYATKSTEVTGHHSGRLDAETIDLYADSEGTHTERLIDACWRLGQPREWRRLRKAAHMFGFAGHFLTKSRRHHVTFRLLRNRRVVYTRTVSTGPDAGQLVEPPTTLAVNFLEFVGSGWRSEADAMLANTSAALAREYQQAAQAELATFAF